MTEDMTPEKYMQKLLSGSASGGCPLRRALDMLGGKWRTHVLYVLFRQGPCRFGELKEAIPKITSTMLSSTLKELEGLGIVHREQFNEIPPHVEYSLTEKGMDLLPIFIELAKWGEKYAE